MTFKQRLKDLRAENHLSQMELSAKTGISQSAIAKWKKGKTEPTASALIILSEFFDESVDYLLGLKEYPLFIKQARRQTESLTARLISLFLYIFCQLFRLV
ncbi:MAG: helix-turn-helix transcriptional regulator [Clostridiales bacterium]|nr:helix-turn-helix transcriptional regulator [Clostridiales bacterium]